LSRLAPAAPKRRLKPLPKPPVGFVFSIRAPRNRFGNHFHQPAQIVQALATDRDASGIVRNCLNLGLMFLRFFL